ncbi:MAG: M16 family metallopeptidase [Oligoflexus sp.]
MKPILFLSLFLLLSLSTTQCVTSSQNSSSHSAIEVETLSNGMDLIFHENHKVPLVTLVLAVKAGGFTETPETDGLTHLWEHMFFKGNQQLPNQEAFNDRVRELGIIFNGDTSAEMVRYYFTLPSAYLEEAIAFMYHAIATPLLEKEELSREIKVVLDEYDRSASQPSFELSGVRRSYIYRDKAHLRDPLGQRHIISATTREQLLKMKDEVFVPQNSALLLSGDFDTNLASKLITKYFSSWQSPKNWQAPAENKFPDFPKGGEIIATHPQASTPQISYTFAGPKARSQAKDTYAIDVLISLLGLQTGKFHQKYIESGLSNYAGLGYYTQSQAGEIHLAATPHKDHFQKVRKMLLEEPKLWLEDGYFSEAQLQDVKRSLMISHKYEINKPSEYIKTLAFWWTITGLDYYRTYLAELQKVDMAEIHTVIRKYLIDKPYVSSMLLAPKDAKSLGIKENLEQIRQKINSKQQGA